MTASFITYASGVLRSARIINSHCARCLHSTTIFWKNRKTVKKVASGVSTPSQRRFEFSQGEDKRQIWLQKLQEEEDLKNRHPDSDVYYEPFYAPQMLNLKDAVEIHKELAAPEMLNHENGELHMQLKMNMRTNKSTKFIAEFTSIVLLPHPIDFVPEKKILVFTDNPELQKLALEQGALDAEGEKLVEQIEHGHYHWESYDNVVCHTDFLPKLRPIQKLLRDRVPRPIGGRLGTDIETMLRLHKDGITMVTKKEDSIPEIATLNLPLGRLNWSIQHLEENFSAYIDAIEGVKIARRKGKTIELIELLAPPSPLRLRVVTSVSRVATETVESSVNEETEVYEEEEEVVTENDEMKVEADADDDDDANMKRGGKKK